MRSTCVSPPGMPAYGGVPANNYRTLRDTLIGTDGNDNFDSSYYASYSQWINSGLLTNFLAGGGNDEMGGSVRNDKLWGGTGNDSVYGRSRVAMPMQ